MPAIETNNNCDRGTTFSVKFDKRTINVRYIWAKTPEIVAPAVYFPGFSAARPPALL